MEQRKQRIIHTKGRVIALNIYHCGLCGRRRDVRTYPRSPCSCRMEFPNRYMYFRYQIINFFIWLWQYLQLLFVREWE